MPPTPDDRPCRHDGRCGNPTCRQDAAAYGRRWHELKGRRRHGYKPLVPADPARRRIAELIEGGMTLRAIADAAGLPPSTVTTIVQGRGGRQLAKIKLETARKLFAVRLTRKVASGGYLDATRTRRQISAVFALGYPLADIAARAGVSGFTVGRALTQDRILASTAAAIDEVTRSIGDTPGPSSVSRQRAARRGYRVPAWYDDVTWEPSSPDVAMTADDQAAALTAFQVDRQAAFDQVVELTRQQFGATDIARRMGWQEGAGARRVFRYRQEARDNGLLPPLDAERAA